LPKPLRQKTLPLHLLHSRSPAQALGKDSRHFRHFLTFADCVSSGADAVFRFGEIGTPVVTTLLTILRLLTWRFRADAA